MVSTRATLFGQQVENTIYAKATIGTPTLLDVKNAVDTVAAWWLGSMLPTLGSDVVHREVFGRNLDVSNGVEYTNVTGAGTTGGGGTTSLSGNVSLAVKFLTGLAGRSFRGRNFLIGLPKTAVGGNTVFPVFGAAWVSAYEELFDDFASVDLAWVVVSRVADGIERAEAVVTEIATVALTNLIVDSQVRRLNGRGA